MINIPSDLRKNKDKIIGEMDLRETLCLFLGSVLGIGILYYVRVILGYRYILIIVFLIIPFVLPFLVYGFKRINGMRIDDYLRVFINNNILANKERLNVQTSDELIVKEKKYELIRYYRLIDKNEFIELRNYLKDNKSLILIEYIDYKNENIVVFRFDGKALILEQIRRNKVAIIDKKKEIKDFINNEIEPVKRERFLEKDKLAVETLKKDVSKSIFSKIYKYLKFKIDYFSLSNDEREKLRKETDMFNVNKREKLIVLYNKLLELRKEKKFLQNKTFSDLKEEVDIFESFTKVSAERIVINNNKKIKRNRSEQLDIEDDIIKLRENLKNDDRALYQLHLFNKDRFKQLIDNVTDKIIFINKDDKVDVYFYEIISLDDKIVVVDITKLDKNDIFCKNTILSLEARNYYNHYRKINDLMEII